MTDPTTPDTLTAAAERAREVLPETIADLVFNQLRYSEDPKLIAEVLAMPLRVPALDPAVVERRASRMAANVGLSWTGNSFLASKPAWRIKAKEALRAELACPHCGATPAVQGGQDV